MTGKKFFDINRVQIASPCSMNWNDMRGDNRKRHCSACKMNVYNVAGLSSQEALELIRKAEGGARVCLRLTRREDGTLLTRDCPIGVKLRDRLRTRALVVKAALVSILAFLAHWGVRSHAEGRKPELGNVVVVPPKENVTMGAPVAEPVHVKMGKPVLTPKPTPQAEK